MTTYSVPVRDVAEALVRLCGLDPSALEHRLLSVHMPEDLTSALEWEELDNEQDPIHIQVELKGKGWQ
jgi:hypothetical protein